MRSSRYVFSLAGILLTAVVASALVGACGGSAGHLTASVDSLDFGTVPIGEPASRTVRIKNESRRAVLLTEAFPSCACLTAEWLGPRSLQSGEETTVRVSLVSKDLPAGKLSNKSLEVHSDDADVPVLVVAIHGEVISTLSVTPEILRVGADDAAGRGEARVVKLRTAKGYRLKIQGDIVASPPEWFQVGQKPVPDGIDLLVNVTKDPTRRGVVNAKIVIKVLVDGGKLPPRVQEVKLSIQGTW